MLDSYSGWAAAGIGLTLRKTFHADRDRRAGQQLGRDPELHHVQGHEPLDLQRDPGRLRHRQQRRRGPCAKNDKAVKAGSAEDAAFLMSNAGSVIIVPGYGA